jgi:hypothetical protein
MRLARDVVTAHISGVPDDAKARGYHRPHVCFVKFTVLALSSACAPAGWSGARLLEAPMSRALKGSNPSIQ